MTWITTQRAMGIASRTVVWEHKTYVDPPALAKGDGPIGTYSKYVRQFYAPIATKDKGRPPEISPLG